MMDDQKHDDAGEKVVVVVDDVMLPGFRFHPTDEELVGFYLKRKIQQRPLSIELIKQVDIYKYDPWDLSKLAASGEKEWYFYCPRDRKYRNSARPNRVTASGFWKATGTDRPIYNTSDGSKCIGLKKSLVFYRGRAAKGFKTDWMMHEFRLPSSVDSSPSPKKLLDKAPLPPNEAWAICRIFKKTNSIAQRALLAHAWQLQPPFLESATSDIFLHNSQFTPPMIPSEIVSSSCTSTETGISYTNDFQPNTFSSPSLNNIPYKPSFLGSSSPNGDHQYNYPFNNFTFSQPDISHQPIYNNLLGDVVVHNNNNKTSSENTDFEHCNNYSIATTGHIQDGVISLMGFPFSLPSSAVVVDASWDSPHCPSSEISTTKYIHCIETSSPDSNVFN